MNINTTQIGYESAASKTVWDYVEMSIVVPVYNVQQYVFEALDSIAVSLAHRAELVIVDDGSTDQSSAAVLSWIEQRDFNAKLLRGKNQGLGAARNGGLTVASGKYLAFFDSDDYAISSTYVNMLDLAKKHNLDLMLSRSRWFDNVTLQGGDLADHAILNQLLENRDFIITNILRNPELLRIEPSVCNRLFSRQFFDAAVGSFPVGRTFEDFTPHMKSLSRSERIGVLNDHLLNYRVGRLGQLTSRRGNADIIKSVHEVARDDYVLKMHGVADEAGAYVCGQTARMVRWCAEACKEDMVPYFLDEYITAIEPFPKYWWQLYAEKYADNNADKLFCLHSRCEDKNALRHMLIEDGAGKCIARNGNDGFKSTLSGVFQPVRYAKYELIPRFKADLVKIKGRVGV